MWRRASSRSQTQVGMARYASLKTPYPSTTGAAPPKGMVMDTARQRGIAALSVHPLALTLQSCAEHVRMGTTQQDHGRTYLSDLLGESSGPAPPPKKKCHNLEFVTGDGDDDGSNEFQVWHDGSWSAVSCVDGPGKSCNQDVCADRLEVRTSGQNTWKVLGCAIQQRWHRSEHRHLAGTSEAEWDHDYRNRRHDTSSDRRLSE